MPQGIGRRTRMLLSKGRAKKGIFEGDWEAASLKLAKQLSLLTPLRMWLLWFSS